MKLKGFFILLVFLLSGLQVMPAQEALAFSAEAAGGAPEEEKENTGEEDPAVISCSDVFFLEASVLKHFCQFCYSGPLLPVPTEPPRITL